IYRGKTCYDKSRHVGEMFPRVFYQFHPVDPGHLKICDQKVNRGILQDIKRFYHRGCLISMKILGFQVSLKHLKHVIIVINYKYVFLIQRHINGLNEISPEIQCPWLYYQM